MKNTREIAEEYRLTHWAQVMQERMRLGLTIKEFCKQAGMCQNTYFYWQRRVRAAAIEQIEQSSIGGKLLPIAPVVAAQAQTILKAGEAKAAALPIAIPTKPNWHTLTYTLS